MDWCRDNLGLASIASAAALQSFLGEELMENRSENYFDMAPFMKPDTESNKNAIITPIIRSTVARISRFLPRLAPMLDYPAYSNLTTTFLRETFNPLTPDDPAVLYLSYVAKVDHMPLFHPLRVPWEVVGMTEGDNDGLVSLRSGRWGHLMRTVAADHWEMTGGASLLPGFKRKFDVLEFYANVASTLHEQGC